MYIYIILYMYPSTDPHRLTTRQRRDQHGLLFGALLLAEQPHHRGAQDAHGTSLRLPEGCMTPGGYIYVYIYICICIYIYICINT